MPPYGGTAKNRWGFLAAPLGLDKITEEMTGFGLKNNPIPGKNPQGHIRAPGISDWENGCSGQRRFSISSRSPNLNCVYHSINLLGEDRCFCEAKAPVFSGCPLMDIIA